MLKIKAWIIVQQVGTTKKLNNQKLVFGTRKFKEVINFLESKERAFDDKYWKNRRTKHGVIGHRNDDWIAYRFYEIKILIP